jgi:hypothetical protein
MIEDDDTPSDPRDTRDEPSTYFARQRIEDNLERLAQMKRGGIPYVNGSEESVPQPAVPQWSKDAARLPDEPPLSMVPGDLRSPVLGVALGGAGKPKDKP